ncbi:MAG: helix-turn-helix domain-containing protein [Actinobacteria bacterium]|jgi:excisionase family DNA binding protein|nr:helix-turn-helix domain-containing protein [Actinomycetota bacterium]MDA8184125.1 helix-turn-helix domain-containing protein [Actinomycetota bacterium]
MAMTVIEVARRTGRDPETVRRWIRSGKLRASKVGLQHLIEEEDVRSMQLDTSSLPGAFPAGWGSTATGEPMPDVVDLVREGRRGH